MALVLKRQSILKFFEIFSWTILKRQRTKVFYDFYTIYYFVSSETDVEYIKETLDALFLEIEGENLPNDDALRLSF